MIVFRNQRSGIQNSDQVATAPGSARPNHHGVWRTPAAPSATAMARRVCSCRIVGLGYPCLPVSVSPALSRDPRPRMVPASVPPSKADPRLSRPDVGTRGQVSFPENCRRHHVLTLVLQHERPHFSSCACHPRRTQHPTVAAQCYPVSYRAPSQIGERLFVDACSQAP